MSQMEQMNEIRRRIENLESKCNGSACYTGKCKTCWRSGQISKLMKELKVLWNETDEDEEE